MIRRVSRSMVTLAVVTATLLSTTAGLAQMPKSPWKRAAPFPEPDEELYGVASNGKMYVIGGWDDGKARGANYEYDPATDKWTKKASMPRKAHHPALASYKGKIYVFGGFVPPENTNVPLGGAWQPIDNAWEYDPAADDVDLAVDRGGEGVVARHGHGLAGFPFVRRGIVHIVRTENPRRSEEREER